MSGSFLIFLLQSLILRGCVFSEARITPGISIGGRGHLPSVLLCTQVRDKLSDVLEWAEYHYLQGASQIVVYDDLRSDNLQNLNDLYAKHNRSS
jgi:hypothetical protein